MLYVFSSAQAPRVTYTGAVGEEILRLAGKTAAPRGVITPAEIGDVQARLAAAMAAEESRAPDAREDDASPADGEPVAPAVSLRLRLVPFLELLARAAQTGKDVTWGL